MARESSFSNRERILPGNLPPRSIRPDFYLPPIKVNVVLVQALLLLPENALYRWNSHIFEVLSMHGFMNNNKQKKSCTKTKVIRVPSSHKWQTIFLLYHKNPVSLRSATAFY